ncbi:MAG: hypothetical protein JWR03_2214 [Cohnella sp.]|jgi:hypothetical protein|nr:hypothetical protein [Cohnella sp.]
MRAVFFSFIVSCLALLLFMTPASAAAKKVEVAIPTFAVLKVHDIDVLYDDHQTLMIKAYNDRLDSKMAAKTDGFYTTDTHLIAHKIADSIPGTGYVGQNKQVFVLNPDKNSITNVTTKKSHRWWDYELRPGI